MESETSTKEVIKLHDLAVKKLKEFLNGSGEITSATELLRIKVSMTAIVSTGKEMALKSPVQNPLLTDTSRSLKIEELKV